MHAPAPGPGIDHAAEPTGPQPPRAPRQRLVGSLLLLLTALVAVTAALLAFLLAALLSSDVAVLAAAALAALAGVGYAVAGPAARRLAPRRTGHLRIGVAAGLALLVGSLAAVTVFRPTGQSATTPQPAADTRYWDLPTGSRIAYRHVPATGQRRSTPVVILHGGPALPEPLSDHPAAVLARDGFDVYVYHQVGSGRSSRLADVRGYTVRRHVDDLEAIRIRLGSERIVLLGHSWGASLAAAYLHVHPQHVARVVFEAPGPLWAPAFRQFQDLNAIDRLPSDARARLAVQDRARRSRNLTARSLTLTALSLVNPNAARDLVDDPEADGLLQANIAGPSLGRCTVDAPIPLEGVGYYASQLTLVDTLRLPDPRPELRHATAPALVLRGSCDYVAWEVAREFRDTIPGTVLIPVPGAGHYLHLDQPESYLRAVRSFLLEQPLPAPPYTADTPPVG